MTLLLACKTEYSWKSWMGKKHPARVCAPSVPWRREDSASCGPKKSLPPPPTCHSTLPHRSCEASKAQGSGWLGRGPGRGVIGLHTPHTGWKTNCLSKTERWYPVGREGEGPGQGGPQAALLGRVQGDTPLPRRLGQEARQPRLHARQVGRGWAGPCLKNPPWVFPKVS